MLYRPLGRSGLLVSVVGFGTCQLRMVPARQALATLRRGFELGVNFVHTAPDYEGADDLVARAIRESGREVTVLTQGYGNQAHFEWLFDMACRRAGGRPLPAFGIACVEDRELLGENVWGEGGMVPFLLEQKRKGHLRAIYAESHGPPEYIAKLVTSGVFDAVLIAYNALGFHALSYFPQPPVRFEDLERNRDEIFPLARRHGVAILLMKTLGGGLACAGKAFPPHHRFSSETRPLSARTILRALLREHPEVTAVVPGTASEQEAQENALAGHGLAHRASAGDMAAQDKSWQQMRASLCTRCGHCDSLCSRQFPVSWLFRDAYVSTVRAETFETVDRLQYFHLHPSSTLACETCDDRSCACPHGLDIPSALSDAHAAMLALRERQLLPPTPLALAAVASVGPWAVRPVHSEVPHRVAAGERAVCRLWWENGGTRNWEPADAWRNGKGLRLVVRCAGAETDVALRHVVEPGTRTHFSFELDAPAGIGEQCVQVFPALRVRSASRRGTGDPDMDLASHPVAAVGRRHAASYGYLNMTSAVAGRMASVRIQVHNACDFTWLRIHPHGHSVDLAVWMDGGLLATVPLPQDQVAPGEDVVFGFPLQLPAEAGHHDLLFDMVEQQVALFRDLGSTPHLHRLNLVAAPLTAGARLQEQNNRLCPWNYRPSGGIEVAADGASFPLFVDRAEGCRFWDTEGRPYLDYIMGWGSALLGYAEPRVQRAISDALASAALVPLPHRLEVQVAELLTEQIPSAERVVFGKHGSDPCTVAVRLARVLTGRRTVLYCGYHGWQDWWVEQAGFAQTGVPPHPQPLAHAFRCNDPADFERLYAQHRDDLAAVMLEPAGPAQGSTRLPEDADAGFLRLLRDRAHGCGALLIYDEVMTGFRYPGGSVQAATGVLPDLTCLGKALGGGMPLAALVGRADVMDSGMHRTHYGPTFRGELYSLAAACAALQVYASEPVAAHVTHVGERLRAGINGIARQLGSDARCGGPAFRTAVVFPDADAQRMRLKRTLFFQELMKLGVMSYHGHLIPSYAHDDVVVAQTLERVGTAIERVLRAEASGGLRSAVDIPLLN